MNVPPTAIVLGAIVAPDLAANAQVPVAYYVATLSVLGSIVVVLKTWSWVRKEMKEVAKAENAELKTEIKHVKEKLNEIAKALRLFPCVSGPTCNTGERPAITPAIALPAYSPAQTPTPETEP